MIAASRLVHRVEAVLLGMPVRIACAGAASAASVRKACGTWDGAPDRAAAPLLIEVRESARSAMLESPRIEVAGGRMTLSGRGVAAAADAAGRRAVCTLSPELLGSPGALRADVLEPLCLFLATRNGRVPIHASGVELDALAVLFSGPSGAGKSSLALAASRAGMAVISEDTVYVQQEPHLAIWGWRGPIHLLAKDAGTSAGPPRLRNGRVKFAIEPYQGRAAREPATSATLCLLQHGERASLAPISQERALAGLGALEPGFDLLRSEIEAVLARLTANGAWLLTLSGSPEEAVALVRKEAEALRGRATGR
uniref:hypothetical protein n=1 Tax=Altererythrobacter segetis TaxID=1104773 RepID=UPI00140AE034|nr:hypothetical protein [Altererythrobacter segetis]